MSLFLCPKCGAPLEQTDSVYVCPEHHSYDRAKEGYVHLLPVHKMHAKVPGDSKEMAAARRLFLDSGAYSGLRDALCGCAAKYAAEFPKPVTMVDCGCGEGYYTVGMYDAVPGMQIIGVDISKNVLAAAHSRINSNGMKRNIFCAAASVFRLPLEDACADMAAVIFAPFQREELLRVVKPGGVILTAIPGERHLYGLKSVLYDEPRLNEVKPYEIEGMEFLEKREVSSTLRLTSQELLNALFTMTPYYYKTSQHDSSRLYSWFGTHDSFETETEFQVLCYRVK